MCPYSYLLRTTHLQLYLFISLTKNMKTEWFFSEPSRRPLVASSRWRQVPNRWCAQPVWGRRLSGIVIISNHLKLHNGEEHLYVISEHLKYQLVPPPSVTKNVCLWRFACFCSGVGTFARRTLATPINRTFAIPKYRHLPPQKSVHLPGGQLPPPIFFFFSTFRCL